VVLEVVTVRFAQLARALVDGRRGLMHLDRTLVGLLLA
jgi:hypothetical protein